MDRYAPEGQKCSAADCQAHGEPSRDVPGSAWCAEHAALPLADRIAAFHAAVAAQEEADHAAP